MENEVEKKIAALDKALNLFPTKIVINLNEAMEDYAEVCYSYMSRPLESTKLCEINLMFAQLISARLPLSDVFVYTDSADVYSKEPLSVEQVRKEKQSVMLRIAYIKMESLEEALKLLVGVSGDASMLVPLFLRHNEHFVLLNAQDLFEQNVQGKLNKATLRALSALYANYDREICKPESAMASVMDAYKKDIALMPEKRKAEHAKKPPCCDEEIDGWRDEDELKMLDGIPLGYKPERF